jgi:hypothetical protein
MAMSLVTACVVVCGGGIASAQGVVPVSDLIARGDDYADQEITIEGELVGDYGFRSDGFMWTQLNDDSYARAAIVDGGPRTGANIGVGVRMPSALAADLDPVGGYRLEGPVVALTGIWRFHDPARGGESYLEVRELIVVDRGRRLQEGPDWVVFSIGVVLLASASALWGHRRRSERAALDQAPDPGMGGRKSSG